MILFYNSNLKFLDAQNEVSFSYSKKAGKEGSGKIELLKMPPQESIYIIILDCLESGEVYANPAKINSKSEHKSEHIASGYIESFNKQKTGVIQLSFKTFEGVLKNLRLPRYWHNYENWKLDNAIMDLLFQTVPEYYTTKEELFFREKQGGKYVGGKHILYVENIEYENIENSDLTLAFDKKQQIKDNVYYYHTQGSIIYLLDFGDEKTSINYKIKKKIIENNETPPTYSVFTSTYDATRVLRYNAQEGAKTFIYWRAIEIENDNKLTEKDIENLKKDIENIKTKLNTKPLLYFRRDEKDYAERCGVALPSKHRYVALELIMRYKNPDYNNDFNTAEINKSTNGEKYIVKRTIRGFTPILHGFEIVKRRPINPLENPTVEIAFDASSITINNMQLENMSLLDAIEKLKEKYNFDIAFDLRLQDESLTPTFYVSIFRRTEIGAATYYGVDRRWDEASLLRENENVIIYNNFNIKEQKKTLKAPYVLYVEGKGNPFDAIHLTFLITYQLIDGEERHIIRLVKNRFLSINSSILNSCSITVIESIPKTPMLREQRVEFKEIETIDELIKKTVEYINNKEIKESTFEVDIVNPARLYDKVQVLSGSNNATYDAIILEEKINKKNNKLTKSLALDGSFFNPFDIFFKSKIASPLSFYPTIPISLEITSHRNILKMKWEALGAYDDFTIKIKRSDKKYTFGFEQEKGSTSIFTQGDQLLDDKNDTDPILPILPIQEIEPLPKPPSEAVPQPNPSDPKPPEPNPPDPPGIIIPNPNPPTKPISNRNKEIFKMLSVLQKRKEKIHLQNITSKRNDKSFPIQYIITKNKQLEISGLSYNILYEVSVATNLDGKKSNYCISIFCKLKPQDRHIKHINSLDNLQGEDGDIAFYLDHKKRDDEHINKAFIDFHCNEHPLNYNSLSSFFENNKNNEKIYSELDDQKKYDALAPYGMYYIWKKGRWAEERLKKPECLVCFFEWRASTLAPIYNTKEKKDYDNLLSFIKAAQYNKKELHKLYALYYHDDWQSLQDLQSSQDEKALANFDLLQVFPPNAKTINKNEKNNSNNINETKTNDDASTMDELPSPPPILLDPDDPNNGLPTVPEMPPVSEMPPAPEYLDSASRNEADENQRKTRNTLITKFFGQLEDIKNEIIHKGMFASEQTQSKHILNSKNKDFNLYYTITNFDFLHNEVYSSGEVPSNDKTPNNDHYIPITERTYIEHFLDKAFLFKYNAHDNGLLEYLTKYKNLGTHSITPKYIINKPIPAINVDFDKTKDIQDKYIEFTFSTYINVQDAYGTIELWNIDGFSIGYYTIGERYDIEKKQTIVDSGTLHFASLGNKVENNGGATIVKSMQNQTEQKDSYTYEDYYSCSIPSNIYIHIMVCVRANAYHDSIHTVGDMKYLYTTLQDIYIDYQKVPISKYVKETNVHHTRFYKPPHNKSTLVLFNTALMPKQPAIYKVEYDSFNKTYSIEDKSEHGYTHYKIALSHTLLFTKYLTMEERLYLKEFGLYPNSNIPKEEADDDPIGSMEGTSKHTKDLDGKYLGVALKTPKNNNDKNIHATNNNKGVTAEEGNFFLQHINSEPFKAGVLYRWELCCAPHKAKKEYKWKELLPYWQYPEEYYIAFKDFDTLISLLPKEVAKNFGMISFLIGNTIFSNKLVVNTGVFRDHIIAPNLPTYDPQIKGALYLSGTILHISNGK